MSELIRSTGRDSVNETTPDPSPEIRIPIIREELVVGKETIETGKVRIEKSVSTEEVSFDLSLTEESYKVVRVPKNEEVAVTPAIRHEGDLTIIPVVREVAVIQKKLMLVEEIHVRRSLTPRETTLHETIRSEEVEVIRESLIQPKNNPTD